MWKPSIVLSEEVRSKALDRARTQQLPVARILEELIMDGLGYDEDEIVEQQQLLLDYGDPDWLSDLRMRHAG